MPTITRTITVKTTVLNIALAHNNGKVHTSHYNYNSMENNIIGHHLQSDCVNNKITASQNPPNFKGITLTPELYF